MHIGCYNVDIMGIFTSTVEVESGKLLIERSSLSIGIEVTMRAV